MSVPTLDPYAILRIGRDATADEIKAAYKRRAFETHPDRGGDESEFHRVNAAYELLSDNERRKKFDATGDASEATPPPNPDAGAFAEISQFLAVAIGGDEDPFQHDLVEAIRRSLNEKLNSVSRDLASLHRSHGRASKMRKRFSRMSDGENILDAQVAWHERQIGLAIEATERKRKNIARAIEIVGEYRFERDMYLQSQFFNSNAQTTSTTSATSGVGLGSIFGAAGR